MVKLLQKVLHLAVVCLALGLAGVTLFASLPIEDFRVDTLSQLRLLYLLIGVVLMVVAMMLRTRTGTYLSAASIIFNGFYCLGLYVPVMASPTGPTVKIVAANIWGSHHFDPDAIVNLVHSEKADVLMVSEVNPRWLKALRESLPEYPYRIIEERVGGGAALYSRIPIQQVQTFGPRRYGVRGYITLGDRKVMLIASHPPSPHNVPRWCERNAEFKLLASDVVALYGTPVIIVGDLNCTPFSHYFHDLLRVSKLVDSEQGHGPQPSWSTFHGIPLVPIDHCLTTPDLVAVDRHVGPANGSDHLPVIVTLGLRAN